MQEQGEESGAEGERKMNQKDASSYIAVYYPNRDFIYIYIYVRYAFVRYYWLCLEAMHVSEIVL